MDLLNFIKKINGEYFKMTGKEFKEYIDRTLQDDDIIYYIDITGNWLNPELEDLRFDREEINGKIYYSLYYSLFS